MKIPAIVGSLLCLTFISAASISARQANASRLPDEQAFMLKIMLLQQDGRKCAPTGKQDGFCDLAELMRGGSFPFQGTAADTRSEDRQHYQASLTPTSGCGVAWFTDERKVFYSGKMQSC